MVRNKNQGQGLNESQRKLSGDNKQNIKTDKNDFQEDDLKENSRKPGKDANSRKGGGSLGKGQ